MDEQEFFGYTGKGSRGFYFRSRRSGIVVAFSAEEWFALGELMAKALPARAAFHPEGLGAGLW